MSVDLACADLAKALSRCHPPGDGCVQARMDLLGAHPLVCYTVNADEDTRRRGACTEDPDVLDLLLGLPVGLPVPVGSLTGRERFGLARTPRWAATVADGYVTRHAVEPVTIHMVLVEARAWRRGLVEASRFAGFCTRAVLLPLRPTAKAALRIDIEAGFYGVGVTHLDGAGGVEVMVQPEPWQRMRFTAAGWRFRERVYRQHRRAQS